ncbi:putative dna-binding protein hgh1 [Phaeomoniella chlamydospora]|uniref:Protein HGH1 homolog n=1 Tax=Phaeomoniella chlamydospora TaxID=158046 RepID=A0A0G2GUY7_PHACM|nr:putative dna-binding protein hgh1 [Phaeomoniella chlamydospora]
MSSPSGSEVVACEHLVGYSTSQPAIFKANQLVPVKDLKLLARDYDPISKNALTILVNISDDQEVLKTLAEDDEFLETLLRKITDVKDVTANEVAMLMANMAKSDFLKRIISLKRDIPKPLSDSAIAMDQLMDCFVKGAEGKINKHADYDYLSYFFADISKHEEGRHYFVTRQAYDDVVPITKLTVFTEHGSHIRRKGVASTLKNVAFEISSHQMLLSDLEANLLPYILLPVAGPEEFNEQDSDGMLTDLQLLPPDKRREPDNDILVTHLETLLLLTTTREGRELMRQVKVYPFIRECHLHVENEAVRDACDRLVQLLLRDEAPHEGEETSRVEEIEDDDDDEKIEELF